MDINNLLKLAGDKKASDIHLIFDQVPVLRIDGVLSDLNTLIPDGNFTKLTAVDFEEFLNILLNREQKTRFFDKRDLDVSYQFDKYRYRGP